ncbi:general secretion pathway protein GspC [Pigmentiphaga aceris]|uniref:General secretion pathway protein GspC n=1 Tax=Pigmentiphaga aceris TaxID=1940612 RepID=A0A5C0B3J5_9BURK|nr:type II secretion system protein N [Pigmentiphaga aceris]QEI08494.1 general secretion pathway protein GspC [Pigmentiphaga aceris]
MSLSLPIRLEPSVRYLALAALAGGVGLWTALLFAPLPGPIPPATSRAVQTRLDTAPLAAWFGTPPTGRAPLRVAVSGIIATGSRGVAVLSFDGGPAQAWRVGQTIKDGLSVRTVAAEEVVLDYQGDTVRVALPRPSPPAGTGILLRP